MACFTKELYRLLKIKGTLSTAYHPQTNGQMEQINQELKVYLQAFVNHLQNDWSDWLPTTPNNLTLRSPKEDNSEWGWNHLE